MISYRDMTFCMAEDCAKFTTCERALTQDVKDSATMWYGPGAPISVARKFEDCYESTKKPPSD